jgi:hypothetical protein
VFWRLGLGEGNELMIPGVLFGQTQKFLLGFFHFGREWMVCVY